METPLSHVKSTMPAGERHLRARVAAYAMHAQGLTNTGPARAAFLDRFSRQVDPEAALPAAERLRRAEFARRAYFAKLALKSAKSRRQRATRGNGGLS